MKSKLGEAIVKYLGHIVGQGQVRPGKFKPSQNSLSPPHRKNLLHFWVWNFSEIAALLTNSLSKKFVWTDDSPLAFDKVKL